MNKNILFFIGYICFILIYITENFFKDTLIGLILGVITFMTLSCLAAINIIEYIIEVTYQPYNYKTERKRKA